MGPICRSIGNKYKLNHFQMFYPNTFILLDVRMRADLITVRLINELSETTNSNMLLILYLLFVYLS